MTANRIVSLVPAATEWLYLLGLGDSLVAVSHECDYPSDVKHLPRVTRSRVSSQASSRQIDDFVRQSSETRTPLYDLDAQALSALQPDLVLTQSLCDVCAVAESDVRCSIGQIEGCELLNLNATTFQGVIDDAWRIIQASGSEPHSVVALRQLQERIDAVREAADKNSYRPRVTLLEWVDPLYCSGHWTPELIDWAGGDDPLGQIGARSRQITIDQLIAADPDILLIACCGLDAARNEQELNTLASGDGWASLKCVAEDNVHVFDGSAFFNRCGPRLVDSLETVAGLVRAFSPIAGPKRF